MTSSKNEHAGTSGKDLLIELLWKIGEFLEVLPSENSPNWNAPIFHKSSMSRSLPLVPACSVSEEVI